MRLPVHARPALRALCAGLWLMVLGGPAAAQTVTLGGTLGDKAVLVIDGVPRTLSRGASHAGVKLVAVSGSEAEIEIANRRVTLQLGGAQVKFDAAGNSSGNGSANGNQIVMTAGSGGHFSSAGSINGQPVVFLVVCVEQRPYRLEYPLRLPRFKKYRREYVSRQHGIG